MARAEGGLGAELVEHGARGALTALATVVMLAAPVLTACGSKSSGDQASGGDDAAAGVEAGGDDAEEGGGEEAAVEAGTPATFKVLDHIPQYGIYDTTTPSYTPPAGVLMWSYGTVFVTKLDAQQQSAIGADLGARVTYFAQCDNYDRLGSIFFLLEPAGQAPQPTDPRIELVRFITPFSDFSRGALATRVYPDADISAYAAALADPTQDVWVGIAGGSNPYTGDPCVAPTLSADYKAVGFLYSLDFVSTKPLTTKAGVTLAAVDNASETAVPITATATNPGAGVPGHVTVLVSGHGSGTGGDEYESTSDTVSVNGAQVGAFSTKIDCSSYAKYSPDGNPGIFQGNTTTNPRNWCPGALVPPHTYPVTLAAGSNSVSLGMTPSAVPSGSYYDTSITFTSP